MNMSPIKSRRPCSDYMDMLRRLISRRIIIIIIIIMPQDKNWTKQNSDTVKDTIMIHQ